MYTNTKHYAKIFGTSHVLILHLILCAAGDQLHICSHVASSTTRAKTPGTEVWGQTKDRQPKATDEL